MTPPEVTRVTATTRVPQQAPPAARTVTFRDQVSVPSSPAASSATSFATAVSSVPPPRGSIGEAIRSLPTTQGAPQTLGPEKPTGTALLVSKAICTPGSKDRSQQTPVWMQTQSLPKASTESYFETRKQPLRTAMAFNLETRKVPPAKATKGMIQRSDGTVVVGTVTLRPPPPRSPRGLD